MTWSRSGSFRVKEWLSVISYPGHFVTFGHFLPIFIFHFVVFVPVFSFRIQFDHFVPTIKYLSKIILYFSCTDSTFLFSSQFVPELFVPSIFISYPGHFVPGYEVTWVRIDLFLLNQTRYEMTLVRNDLFFIVF